MTLYLRPIQHPRRTSCRRHGVALPGLTEARRYEREVSLDRQIRARQSAGKRHAHQIELNRQGAHKVVSLRRRIVRWKFTTTRGRYQAHIAAF